MKKIAVFASGNGSNFQAILDATLSGEVNAEVKLLVCDRPNAFCIERAKQANIPSFIFSAKNYESKEQYEGEIIAHLKELNVEFIVLAGYMRLIGPTILDSFPGKIVNIHPSFLPLFPGKDAIGQALLAGVESTGVTVHYVDEGMDTGPIIAQEEILIEKGDSKESLEQKVHSVEHVLYVQTLKKLFS
ncbi:MULTISPECIES: phosphoribosylglycinamide formyltransferase [Bacillaceae]|jgi:phosphoribosylglycinamide formyltransferase-1|uniref:Phosphoribosylglycinamide formyltransferase n=1 Tax=Gottfriedia luciferensis TaxID=178774 RepID=A0ABX2ZT89_9BACI|nr:MULTISPECIES: phosphoribosylglycinamide formyltransferase [Bacillaceae]KQL34829.1 phosphoribosylglycinamide formyltransferase [Bacillus sp. FJAT-25509]ODG93005.1 phosphoribosylglycinamide formyltransferase [Gottfriedia luciferensis]PGZ92854.1 phosphoribosylglycinamide formyltransferase [Bacillus sp. AFS029533]SFD69789.1 phosphoribosylglycinamide formyltransferase-1 [Bacillus sp. UNCCL81]